MGAELVKVIAAHEVPAPGGVKLPVFTLDLGARTEVAIPLARLVETTGLDRAAVYRLVERDPVLSSYRVVITARTAKVPTRTALLERPGVVGLLFKVSTNRIQEPEVRERVIAFQRWAVETLDRILFQETAPQPPSPKPATAQPLIPHRDPELAVRMLRGEVRSPSGELLSYHAIAAASGVPESTLMRWADKLGLRKLRMKVPTVGEVGGKAGLGHTLSAVLRQQARILELLAAQLDQTQARR